MGCSTSTPKVEPAPPEPEQTDPFTPNECPQYATFGTFVLLCPNPQLFEYRFIRCLGRGAHGEVYLAENTTSHTQYAAKVYSKTVLFRPSMYHDQLIDKVESEIEIMSLFHHPNIVGIVEVLDDDATDSVILIETFAEHGSLLPQAFVSQPIPEDRCRWIFAQIAEAVRVVHESNVAHGDIKPENILTKGEDHALLADFSTAKFLPEESDVIELANGTPAFSSPEQCRGEPYHAKLADIWALGVSLYLMVFGHLPFYERSQGGAYVTELLKIAQAIQENPVVFDDAILISADLRDLLVKLLDKDPGTRISAEQVLAHPWVKQAGYAPEILAPSPD
jgi:serine/threonine protein kinase